jgi:hypothetical protein
LIPDRIPGIGYLDDAIMVELVEGSLELPFGHGSWTMTTQGGSEMKLYDHPLSP